MFTETQPHVCEGASQTQKTMKTKDNNCFNSLIYKNNACNTAVYKKIHAYDTTQKYQKGTDDGNCITAF